MIIIKIIFLKMYVTICVPYTSRGQKTGIRNGVTDDCHLLGGYLVLSIGPLPEQQVLLTTDWIPQPYWVLFKTLYFLPFKKRKEGKGNFIELTNISCSLPPRKNQLFYFTATFKTTLLSVSCIFINFSRSSGMDRKKFYTLHVRKERMTKQRGTTRRSLLKL